jgi:hypothetical protein
MRRFIRLRQVVEFPLKSGRTVSLVRRVEPSEFDRQLINLDQVILYAMRPGYVN